MVELLLREQVGFPVQGKVSPLFLACQNDHCEVVELILKYNANNIQEQDGGAALLLASQKNNYSMMELLLKNLTNPNFKGENGETALMIASLCGNYKIVELLLKEKADLNLQNRQGWTALMLASASGHHSIVELLFKQQANVNLSARDGSTALSLAVLSDNTLTVKLLFASTRQELKEQPPQQSKENFELKVIDMQKTVLTEERLTVNLIPEKQTKFQYNEEIAPYDKIKERTIISGDIDIGLEDLEDRLSPSVAYSILTAH